MEQQFSNNLFSSYLREKYNKALTRFEKGLESGRFASYSKQKKAQIWNRLNRYAKQLGIALRPGLIAACLAAGLCFSSAAAAQTFAEQTGAANPFDGVNVGAQYATPTFVDIDGDGDQDAFSGRTSGTIMYYKNTGTTTAPVFVAQTGAANPLDGVAVGIYTLPTFVDIDGDGDQDVFIGEYNGVIFYYKNTGTTTAPVFVAQTGGANPLNGVDVGVYATPRFEDIDGDGDKDVFIGNNTGTIAYYQNTGTTTAAVFVAQTGGANPFNGVFAGGYCNLTFADTDRDGDKDVFIGNNSGTIQYYKNTGTTTAPVFAAQTGAANPFDGVDVGAGSVPTFVDIDADGDIDAFIGTIFGTIVYYQNIATATVLGFAEQTGAANPFNGINVGAQYATPTFVDIDGDGDNDAFIGYELGTIKYYKNTGTTTAPVFVAQTGGANPLNGVDVGVYATPSFEDIDGDGDKDAFIGEVDGTILYYKNTGTTTAPVFVEQTGPNDPFDGVDVGDYSAPTFVDIDGDGDKDAFSGEASGIILYYKNTGTTTAPVFAAQTGANNPFNGVDVGAFSTPTFEDIDRDGDQDAFIGEQSGTIKYYKNTGTTTAPVFAVQTGAANPFNGVNVGQGSAPTFVDIDADGDMDAFIGESNGSILYYKNTPSCTVPVFTLGATSTRCQVAETISYAATDAVSYSLTGGGSSTINASTGEVVWDAAFSGSATITAIGAGCNATHVVTVNPATSAPTITAGNTSVCVGTNVTLTGVGVGGTATEFAWFRNGIFVKYDTQPTYTFPALAGVNNYTLVVIYGGSCPSSVSTTATVVTGIAPAAVITPSIAPPYCVGAAPTLNANTGTNYTYSWIGTSSNVATTTGSSLVPDKSGNHRVIVTDAEGCSKSSAWIGIVLNNPPAVYPGTNKSTCVNNSVSIGAAATAGLSYSWTPSTDLSSETAANPIVTPTATGMITYSLTVTNTTTGCTNTGTVSVSTTSQPATPSLTGTTSPVCQGTSITLSPSGVTGAINWYKGGLLNSSATTSVARAFSSVNASADNYTIRAKVGTCLSEASNSVQVEIKAAPIPTLSTTPAIVGNTVSVCNPVQTNGTAQLTVNLPSGAPTAALYNWQQFVSGIATNVSPVSTGATYTAAVSSTSNNKAFRGQVTYSNGCVKNTSNVTVKLLPSTCTARTGQDLTETLFTAYPNPTENMLTVSVQNSTASEGELMLYNTLGQKITSRTISLDNGATEESLDLSGLASGVYTLSFQTKDGNQVQKIVKE